VTRPTLDETVFKIARLWSERSTCPRGKAGCVITDTYGGVISQGYNGAPRGIAQCLDDGCIIEGDHCVRSVHAEMNAIIWAARTGVSLVGGHVYCTTRPCIRCAIALIQTDVTSVRFLDPYESDDFTVVRELFRDASIPFIGAQNDTI
jgi:dCMP deaminase